MEGVGVKKKCVLSLASRVLYILIFPLAAHPGPAAYWFPVTKGLLSPSWHLLQEAFSDFPPPPHLGRRPPSFQVPDSYSATSLDCELCEGGGWYVLLIVVFPGPAREGVLNKYLLSECMDV